MRYYVNTKKQLNGDNEVHAVTCSKLPKEENRRYLDDFSSCEPAVRLAKQQGYKANGCIHCCRPCHTT